MKKTLISTSLSVAALFLITAMASGTSDTNINTSEPGQFTANLVDSSNLLPGLTTAYFRMEIEEFGDEQSLETIKQTVKADGQKGLRAEIEGKRVGWMQIGSADVSVPVAYARSFEDSGGRVIQAVVARDITFVEAMNSLRTRDYPFTVVELRLDADGTGSGVLLPAAQIEVSGNGALIIDNYNHSPFHLLNVRPTS